MCVIVITNGPGTWDLALTGFLFSAACLFSCTFKGGVLATYEHFLAYVLTLTLPIQSIISSNRPQRNAS